jgi:neurotransmitter:Na+ symporter, NSS family
VITPERAHWSTRWAFILATAGSAVGLGNIWKFPYMTGANGGSAFVLVYLLCIVLIGIPLMMTEIMLGRRAQKNPVSTMSLLAAEARASRAWAGVGLLGVATGALILSFYSVVAGWMLDYLVLSVTRGFSGIAAAEAQAEFAGLLASPVRLALSHTVFMVLVVTVVALGVKRGLERANRIMVPGLVLILLILLAFGWARGDFGASLRFMLHFDPREVTATAALAALGQAFFTLSLGMGAVMVYGSYLERNVSIGRASVYVALTDTAIALVAGIAIFAIVFGSALEPGAGPGLVMQTLPIAFGQMPGGHVIAPLFFLLLVFAAWTSAISLVEPAVSWLSERTRYTRGQVCAAFGALVWTLGLAVLLSFNAWDDVRIVGLSIFDFLDRLTTSYMMPLGGLLMAIFAGWLMKVGASREELALADAGYNAWRWSVRYVVPIAIVVIFLNLIGAV